MLLLPPFCNPAWCTEFVQGAARLLNHLLCPRGFGIASPGKTHQVTSWICFIPAFLVRALHVLTQKSILATALQVTFIHSCFGDYLVPSLWFPYT